METENEIIYQLVVPDWFQDTYETAWYLYKDGTQIETQWYQATDTYKAIITEPGQYYVKCFVKTNAESVVTSFESEMSFYGKAD